MCRPNFWVADALAQAAYLWSNGAKQAYGVYRSRIGMRGRHFDWYRFRLPRSTLTPHTGDPIVDHNLRLDVRLKLWLHVQFLHALLLNCHCACNHSLNDDRQSNTLYCEVLGSRGWAFDLYKSRRPNTSLTPKIWDLKTPSLNYSQVVAYGETF